jgi:2'-hydroxyisoflavone reductase
MTASRRTFLKSTAAFAGLAALAAAGSGRAQAWEKPRSLQPAQRKLRLLFMGGTGFIGPHQVQHALARGHEVTLFNRGKTNPHLFPETDRRQGDRQTGDYASLAAGEWDAIIDNSAHRPRWVREAAAAVSGRCRSYLFISSTGVYHPYTRQGIDEHGTLAAAPDDHDPAQITGHNFGGLKVLCEQEAERCFPGRTTVIRPHLICGPGDTSDRFTYWPVRLARGGEVLAPPPDDPVQWIDVRDLAAFTIGCIEEGRHAVFNAVGPRSPCTVAGLLHGLRALHANEVSFTWTDHDFLAAEGIGGWTDLTVWIPPVGEYLGMNTIDGSKAITAGLGLRPLFETARDTLAWWEGLPAERRASPRAGLAADREQEILAAWRARG